MSVEQIIANALTPYGGLTWAAAEDVAIALRAAGIDIDGRYKPVAGDCEEMPLFVRRLLEEE